MRSWPWTLPLLLLACQAQEARTTAPPASAKVTADRTGADPKINEELRKVTSEEDVQPWVERFEREGREIFDRCQQIVDALGIEPGDTVADVGAGTGLFLEPLAAAVGVSGKLYAVDIVPGFLDHIRERSKDLPQVETVLGTDVATNLPPGSVDLIFICDTYHHFEEPGAMLDSIRRALRPGGVLVIVDFERIPGETSDWIMDHVRAGKDVVRQEVQDGGFEPVEELDVGLTDNYCLRFRTASS